MICSCDLYVPGVLIPGLAAYSVGFFRVSFDVDVEDPQRGRVMNTVAASSVERSSFFIFINRPEFT
jgi:hypothetical protein